MPKKKTEPYFFHEPSDDRVAIAISKEELYELMRSHSRFIGRCKTWLSKMLLGTKTKQDREIVFKNAKEEVDAHSKRIKELKAIQEKYFN